MKIRFILFAMLLAFSLANGQANSTAGVSSPSAQVSISSQSQAVLVSQNGNRQKTNGYNDIRILFTAFIPLLLIYISFMHPGIFMKRMRALINVSNPEGWEEEITQDTYGKRVCLVKIKNTGGTYARSVKAQGRISPIEGPFPKDFSSIAVDQAKITRDMLGPWTELEIRCEEDGDAHIPEAATQFYVYGRIDYRDMRGIKRMTTFCFLASQVGGKRLIRPATSGNQIT